MVTAKGQDPVAITGQEPVAAKNQEPVVAGPVIGDIFFDFNSSALNNEAQEQLKQNAAWMQKHPLTTVTIEGHCDERGTDEYNLALGERRAIVAMDYLVTFGINGQRLTIISYGEEQPFDQGHNEEAWSRNRRNHFISK
ncbi:MAG: peptidoglycan-associated lipoprotein Pal [Chlorobiaceae bacterium]|nr:peptidoglycan-associated lipoprotein Pal [Chlorobiaceae bacterium]